MESNRNQNKKYHQMIVTPEFMTHPIFSNIFNYDVAKKKKILCLPKTIEKYFCKKSNNALAPFVTDKSKLELLKNIDEKIHFSKIKNTEKYNNIRENLLSEINELKKCSLYNSIEFTVELLAYAASENKPLLMATSSESRFIKFIKNTNEWMHLIHKPALIKLIDGDKEFKEKMKEYAKTKMETFEPLTTPQSRGALTWAISNLVIGEVFLTTMTGGGHLLAELGWFVFYDP